MAYGHYAWSSLVDICEDRDRRIAELEHQLAEAQDKRQVAIDGVNRIMDRWEKAQTDLEEAHKVIAALRGPFDAAPGVIGELRSAMERAMAELGAIGVPHVQEAWGILNEALAIQPFSFGGPSWRSHQIQGARDALRDEPIPTPVTDKYRVEAPEEE